MIRRTWIRIINALRNKISKRKLNICKHPDILACVPFLQNTTNKRTESPTGPCAGMGDPRSFIIYPRESNPEGYCLTTANTEFCRTVRNLCDPGGFVRPEYPYCKGVTN